jgi:hypothetical protein
METDSGDSAVQTGTHYWGNGLLSPDPFILNQLFLYGNHGPFLTSSPEIWQLFLDGMEVLIGLHQVSRDLEIQNQLLTTAGGVTPDLRLQGGSMMKGSISYSESNYEVFDMLNWQLDGFVYFPY